MIALGKHEVHVFLQSMADKYTAVWCKWNNNRCIVSLCGRFKHKAGDMSCYFAWLIYDPVPFQNWNKV